MTTKLDDWMKFFIRPTKLPMPESLRIKVLAGDDYSYGNMETRVLEWQSIDRDDSEVAAKIGSKSGTTISKAYNVPILNLKAQSWYYAYDPIDGEYLGPCSLSEDY